jgi:hypothetical protein
MALTNSNVEINVPHGNNPAPPSLDRSIIAGSRSLVLDRFACRDRKQSALQKSHLTLISRFTRTVITCDPAVSQSILDRLQVFYTTFSLQNCIDP